MGDTYQSIVINAAEDDVWSAIRDFHNLSWAPNVITSLDVLGDVGSTAIGAQRLLNGVFKETLRTLDDEAREFTYSIDEGPGPLAPGQMSNYVGKVTVKAADGGGTVVEWTSSWDDNDEAVRDFCHPIYVALLDDMKQSLE